MLLVPACHENTAPDIRVPAKLAFLTVQPASTIARTTISPAVRVAVQDAAGETITTATNSITMAIGTNAAGGTLSGSTTVAAIDGVATFSNLSIDNVGSGYTLSATSPNLSNVNTSPFNIVIGPAVKLAFTVQPVSTLGRTLIPTVAVAVRDVAGNTVSDAAVNIALTIELNPGDGVLSGTTVRPATNGVATFSDLKITSAGVGYTLRASALAANGSPLALTNAISAAFDQTVGAAAWIIFVLQPQLTRPGEVISPTQPVQVTVQDTARNIVRTATASITMALQTNPVNGTLSGTTTVAAVNGVATFSDLRVNNPGTGYRLIATADNLRNGISIGFTIRDPVVFATVTVGYFHSCGVTASGVAYCWGANSFGQKGDSRTTPSQSFPPESVSAGGLTFASISAGRNHTCATTAVGVGYCWGWNENGQLGSPGTSIFGTSLSTIPVVISGGLTFAVVKGGYAHSCGLTNGGAAYCWGDNSAGALGTGTLTPSSVPAATSGGLTLSSVSPGRQFSCGLTTEGAGYCWGANGFGQIGDGTTQQRLSPVKVSGQLQLAMIGAGGFHACGLTSAGQAHCWGANEAGQLGDNSVITRNTPVAVAGGLTFASLSVGDLHVCALTPAGIAYCWGDNSMGKLGNGTANNSSVPVAVAGGHTFASINAGGSHTCAVTAGRAAYCWGDNLLGQLGDGTAARSFVPRAVR